MLVVIIVKQGVAFVGNVAVIHVFHRHVDLLSVLCLLHVQRRVCVVETTWVFRWEALHRPHGLVLRIQYFRDVGLQFLLF